MSSSDPPWVSCCAGAFAGFTQDALLHPIDTLRTKLQVQPSGSTNPFGALVQLTRQVVQLEGISGLYRGFSTVVVFGIPTGAIYLGGYSYWRLHVQRGLGITESATLLQSAIVDLTAGLIAEVGASIILTPYDILKQKLQTDSRRSVTLLQVGREVYDLEGVRGFYRGLAAGIGVYGPFSAIFFSSYEATKSMSKLTLGHEERKFELKPAFSGRAELLCGVFAGAIAAAATQPLDCIKTRMQTAAVISGAPKLGFMGTFAKTVGNEGVGSLFRGTFARYSNYSMASCFVL